MINHDDCFEIFQQFVPGLQPEQWKNKWESLTISERESVLRGFSFLNRPLVKRLLYRCAVSGLNCVPFSLRRFFIDLLKGLRKGSSHPSVPSNLFHYRQSAAYRLTRSLGERDSQPEILITYDLDQNECINYLETGFNLLHSRNLKATFNILTGGNYPCSAQLVKSLSKQGNSLGLHGHKHDIDFGNRSPQHIAASLSKAKEILGCSVNGFRSPALSVSPGLYTVLENQGFAYESSLMVNHPFYVGSGVPYPFKIPGTHLIEYPILFQDNVFFSDFKMADDEALKRATEVLDMCLEDGGVAVLNLHLCIEKHHPEFHEGLLDYIALKGLGRRSLEQYHLDAFQCGAGNV